MKVLVTGGAGFIGSHLCERLLGEGNEVTCLDNFNNFYNANLKRANVSYFREHENFEIIEANLLDLPRVRSLLSAGKFDVVVHMAANSGTRASVQNPLDFETVNVRGTLHALLTCKESAVQKVIFASSAAVYGTGQPTPFKESSGAGRVTSPYGASKLAGEALCHAYHHMHGMDVSVLRYFNVYGPRQRPDMALYSFTRRGMEGRVLKRFGDGTAVRDFVHVDDAVDATVRAIDKCEGFEIYNVGSGTGTTVRELLQMVTNALQKELEIEELEPMAGELPLALADISKAKLKLGFKPQVKLEEGIERFVSWMEEEMENEMERKSAAELRMEMEVEKGEAGEGDEGNVEENGDA